MISLGIELGSTRIKLVLIDKDFNIISQGNYTWENKIIDGYWTYHEELIWDGLQKAYKNLKKEYQIKFNKKLKKIDNIGISAMMHGYLVLDKNDEMLVPFRTWRNTKQKEASEKLTKLYNFSMPQRFSNTHFYQAMLNDESHLRDVKFQTTLAGYVHYKLTSEKVLGIGDASGMFPIDIKKKQYNMTDLKKFNDILHDSNINYNYEDILPKVLLAGENAGSLTKKGSQLLDPTGELEIGARFCPPEGDAGTGMVATNSVEEKTGNVSVGTSVFAMVVLEKSLKTPHKEIDIVTTPNGKEVAMVHCNNGSSELNRWMNIFEQVLELMKVEVNRDELFTKILENALLGDIDAGGLLSYEYLSGEHITDFSEGRTLFLANSHSTFNLENFILCRLYSSFATLAIGMEILASENIQIDRLYGHGGLFKTKNVTQKVLSQATKTPVVVNESAQEGGAWGIALLAAYINNKKSLSEYLNEDVFANVKSSVMMANKQEIEGYESFLERFKSGLSIEEEAIKKYK